ncbi:uncharacterized protein A4U43_C07F3840 [Asparagus officinalis]|uniref:MIP18 family-like domain-containing protein n=1 Tax=Asparagus officinalis TaxID=4686 RepID=A0A5P1E958_ASPOF|nr:uncharacterized protein A4U43_C07F3840 [Asparagus officinalis]
MATGLINANPIVYERKERRVRDSPIDTDEDIKDPEHPYSLEELKVVTEDSIEVNNKQSHVRVTFTPTVEHCSMATIIGLCLRVKLMRSLPPRYKVDIRVAPGTHATEAAGIFPFSSLSLLLKNSILALFFSVNELTIISA